jgi:hypothetical protein
MNTTTVLIIIGIFLFGLGFIVGSACERRCLNIADDQKTLIYQGVVYIQVYQDNTLEGFLTAAGRKR